MKSKLTNSEIGSTHWFRTLISQIKEIGEYMSKYGKVEHPKEWGKQLEENSKELLQWKDSNKMEKEKIIELAIIKSLIDNKTKNGYNSLRLILESLSDLDLGKFINELNYCLTLESKILELQTKPSKEKIIEILKENQRYIGILEETIDNEVIEIKEFAVMNYSYNLVATKILELQTKEETNK